MKSRSAFPGRFRQAFDGPAVDPKVLEAEQKKFQEELQKRADEERKKLEAEKQGDGSPTGGAAPPTRAGCRASAKRPGKQIAKMRDRACCAWSLRATIIGKREPRSPPEISSAVRF